MSVFSLDLFGWKVGFFLMGHGAALSRQRAYLGLDLLVEFLQFLCALLQFRLTGLEAFLHHHALGINDSAAVIIAQEVLQDHALFLMDLSLALICFAIRLARERFHVCGSLSLIPEFAILQFVDESFGRLECLGLLIGTTSAQAGADLLASAFRRMSAACKEQDAAHGGQEVYTLHWFWFYSKTDHLALLYEGLIVSPR
ncbi:MAG: hypothetical protein IPH05_03175 [Flavobacteriales bacterium]|nr:hypothetical protein [Flavobacteriales bacterium]MBK7113132.1 hypothetical protein [Flavobacteriales bacterium]MBK8709687.1 hypothetical protein [Flavobacteriales bacterium]MBK9626321.1 hypothetical protein [Flavobacteriales bacterium]MBP8877779.1 hypothetical protein [Flavobacteriales bacterium]